MSIDIAPELCSQFEKYRGRIDESLDRYSQFGPDCPSQLKDAIRYMLLAPGKRIRPLLTLFATEACGGEFERAVPAACAVEMVHTYSLIHDDLPSMDDDEFRRGQPTCHRQFDEATAILAGDALQATAFAALADLEPVIAAKCCAILATACGAENLVGGQVDDLAGCNEQPTLEKLEQIHRRKTAALLTASLKLGATVAEADEESITQLEIYGQKLGMAFQIVDDLLDNSGDETKMGKRSGTDRENGTMTFPKVLGDQTSRELSRKLIQEAIDSLKRFDHAADKLRDIAQFVLNRDF